MNFEIALKRGPFSPGHPWSAPAARFKFHRQSENYTIFSLPHTEKAGIMSFPASFATSVGLGYDRLHS